MRSQANSSHQTTCYVIAYDIPDDKRRTKVHKILLGHGKWTQYSLFECFLTRKQLLLLQARLAEHLESSRGQRPVLSAVRELCEQGGNGRRDTPGRRRAVSRLD